MLHLLNKPFPFSDALNEWILQGLVMANWHLWEQIRYLLSWPSGGADSNPITPWSHGQFLGGSFQLKKYPGQSRYHNYKNSVALRRFKTCWRLSCFFYWNIPWPWHSLMDGLVGGSSQPSDYNSSCFSSIVHGDKVFFLLEHTLTFIHSWVVSSAGHICRS